MNFEAIYDKEKEVWYPKINGLAYKKLEFTDPVSAELFAKEIQNEYNKKD